MTWNKLLDKQIKTYLPEELLLLEPVSRFIKAVNNSYNSYERDRALSEHAFRINEQDYAIVNDRLSEELRLKRLGIKNLKEAIRNIDDSREGVLTINMEEDNLLDTLSYLNEQIVKRKKVEKELKDSQYRLSAVANRLSELIKNLHNGILVEDENRKIVVVNKLFCDIFGIPARPEELIGMDCADSANDSRSLFKDPEKFTERIEEILQARQLVTGDELELTDGRVLVRDYVPIYSDNEYSGHLWKYEDVTGEKENQRELERLSLLASSNENGVVFTNPDGVISWSNEGFSRLTGYSKEEIMGRTPLDLCKGPLSEKDDLKNMLNAFYTGKSFNIEVIHYRKDGSWFWGKVKGQSILDERGQITQYFAMVEDITMNKLAEQALQIKEEKYRGIITNMNLGLLEVDVEENILYANQSFCQMSGYTEQELIGLKTPGLFVKGESLELTEKRNESRKNGVSEAYEVMAHNKKGEPRWWLISGAPRFNGRGKWIGSIGIHLDITNQKKLEQELIEARDQAEESSRAKETFLANMSHEIRTPINAILGMSRELRKTPLNPRQQLYLGTVNAAAENLLVVINDILDISKIEAGKLMIECIGFSLKDLLTRVTRVMLLKAEEKGLQLSYSMDPRIAAVLMGDPYRLSQVLLNLLSNAVKFTDKGSVTIQCSLEEEPSTILPSGSVLPPARGSIPQSLPGSDVNGALPARVGPRQFIRITVTDTGIGMEKYFLDHLFQKFLQEDKSVARKYGGTGLGMSICKQLAELMNGTIGVTSKKDEGTRISLHLPFFIGSGTDLKQKEEITTDTSLLKNSKILLVEDNEMNRLVATTILNNYGALVSEVVNGAEALTQLNTHPYDLVLMDVQMPVMDGLEATRRIRADIDTPIPIIALTANAIKGESDRCLHAGMNDYIAKPFDEEVLISKIAYWLAKKAATGTTPLADSASPATQPTQPDPPACTVESPLYSLDKLKEISRGDDSFIQKMLLLFLEQVPVSVKEIRKAYESCDFAAVKAITHRTKPIIFNFLIGPLEKEMEEMEKLALKKDDSGRIGDIIGKVEYIIAKIVIDIQKKYPLPN